MGDMACCAGNTVSSFLGVHRRLFVTRADPLEGPAVALSKRVAKANHPTGASLPAEPTTAPPPHEFTFVPFVFILRFTSFSFAHLISSRCSASGDYCPNI